MRGRSIDRWRTRSWETEPAGDARLGGARHRAHAPLVAGALGHELARATAPIEACGVDALTCEAGRGSGTIPRRRTRDLLAVAGEDERDARAARERDLEWPREDLAARELERGDEDRLTGGQRGRLAEEHGRAPVRTVLARREGVVEHERAPGVTEGDPIELDPRDEVGPELEQDRRRRWVFAARRAQSQEGAEDEQRFDTEHARGGYQEERAPPRHAGWGEA